MNCICIHNHWQSSNLRRLPERRCSGWPLAVPSQSLPPGRAGPGGHESLALWHWPGHHLRLLHPLDPSLPYPVFCGLLLLLLMEWPARWPQDCHFLLNGPLNICQEKKTDQLQSAAHKNGIGGKPWTCHLFSLFSCGLKGLRSHDLFQCIIFFVWTWISGICFLCVLYRNRLWLFENRAGKEVLFVQSKIRHFLNVVIDVALLPFVLPQWQINRSVIVS